MPGISDHDAVMMELDVRPVTHIAPNLTVIFNYSIETAPTRFPPDHRTANVAHTRSKVDTIQKTTDPYH